MLNPVSYIKCPNCNQSYQKLNANSILFVCQNCLTVYNNLSKKLNYKISKDQEELANVLYLGDIYKHNDIEYTITGKIVKFERNDPYALWTEYFLTHPDHENIYLAEYNGHWNIIEYDNTYKDYTDIKKNHLDIEIDNIKYYAYHHYIIDICYAIGEFNFNPFDDIGNYSHEYINPPYILIIESKEKKNNPLYYFKGKYLYKKELHKALLTKRNLPAKIDIVGSQPFYIDFNNRDFRKASVIVALFLFIIQLAFVLIYPEKTIKHSNFNTKDNIQAYVLDNINVEYDNSILSISTQCNQLNNDWYAGDMILINNKTSEEYSFLVENEYYQGYEGGESWSEGGVRQSNNIENVKKGSYRLEINAIQQEGSTPKSVDLSIVNYKGSWIIFVLSIGIIILLNIILTALIDSFENKKWNTDD